LKVEFSGTSDTSNQYVLELENAKFMNGKCDGKRVENDISKGIDVPQAAGTLKVRAAWSGPDRKVRVLQGLGVWLRSNVIDHFDRPDIPKHLWLYAQVKVTSYCSYTIVAGTGNGCAGSGTGGGTGGGGGGGGGGGSGSGSATPAFLALVAAAVLSLTAAVHV